MELSVLFAIDPIHKNQTVAPVAIYGNSISCILCARVASQNWSLYSVLVMASNP